MLESRQDRLVGLVLVIGGSLLFWRTYSFHIVDWDPLGLAFWPRIVLGLLIASGAYLILRGSLDDGPFQKPVAKAFAYLAIIGAYAILMAPIGFLIATPVFIVAFHLSLGGWSFRNLIEACILAAVCTGFIYYVFQDLLLVQFPEGLLQEPI